MTWPVALSGSSANFHIFISRNHGVDAEGVIAAEDIVVDIFGFFRGRRHVYHGGLT